MDFKIITDSASDLPKEITKEFDIDVIPVLVMLDDEQYLDGETIAAKDVLDGMREGKVYKTSQPTPNMFYEYFLKYAKENLPCVYIGFSSALSGTYNSAVIAKEQLLEEYPNFVLHIIDTKCASMGFGLVVYKAALMAREGKSIDEIVEKTVFNAKHMEHIFTVDDLEYLQRGGRVSRSAAFIGGILNIKPILNVEDGKLIPIDKVRGRQKAFKRMLDLIQERGINLSEQIIGISHGDDMEAVNKFKQMMELEFGCKEFIINNIGCAVGAHSGPGTLAIFFMNK